MRKVDLKRIMAVFSAVLMIVCMPITALADGLFEGDIIITNVLPDYEYKIYEVLERAVIRVLVHLIMQEEILQMIFTGWTFKIKATDSGNSDIMVNVALLQKYL